MIIDGHAHACGVFNSGDSIIAYIDKNNIDKVILCAGELNSNKDYNYPMLSNVFLNEKLAYFFNKIISKVVKINNAPKYIDEGNKFVYELSANYPERIINVYWVNPLDEKCVHKLDKYYIEYNFKLIKLHQCWNKFKMDSLMIEKIIRWAKEKNMPVFIHLFSNKEVKKFISVSNKFLDVTFIVAHMIGAEEIVRKSRNTNIYFDLSAPQLYSINILKQTIDKVGAEKVILGSDTPYGKDNIKRNLNRLKKLNLSNEQISNILGKNIIRILKL